MEPEYVVTQAQGDVLATRAVNIVAARHGDRILVPALEYALGSGVLHYGIAGQWVGAVKPKRVGGGIFVPLLPTSLS